MDRFGILTRLQDNWPGKYGMSRIQFLERELRQFTNEALDLGVTRVLRTAEFPPTVAVLHHACSKVMQEIARKRGSEERHRPGDVIDGERTLTPQEAVDELVRLRVECPEAFHLVPAKDFMPGELGRYRLEVLCTRIYAQALRKCAVQDDSIEIPADLGPPAGQGELFG